MQAGVGRRPGGVTDLLPELAGLQRLGDLPVGAADQVPVAVGFTARRKSSFSETELLEFWPETVR